MNNEQKLLDIGHFLLKENEKLHAKIKDLQEYKHKWDSLNGQILIAMNQIRFEQRKGGCVTSGNRDWVFVIKKTDNKFFITEKRGHIGADMTDLWDKIKKALNI